MKNVLAIITLLLSIAFIHSCKKDPTIVCEPDPRRPALGTFSMIDSVFFLNTFNDTVHYDLVIRLDTLTGDTILLENMFNFSIDLKAVYSSANGSFVIPPQMDDDALVSGIGTISGNNISYTAAYDDDGYSFIGAGQKN